MKCASDTHAIRANDAMSSGEEYERSIASRARSSRRFESSSARPTPKIRSDGDAARLQEVAASRAQRAAAEEQAREAARPKAVLPMNGRLTSCFCARWGTFHYGIDLAAPKDTPEYAAEDGVVLRAGPATGFGLAVYILHADGFVTVYGHMDVIKVAVGQYVQAGQTIALEGARGQATGPNLHFEVHQGGENGTSIDSIPWLRARGVTV